MIEPLTQAQIAEMLPDQLRVYLANLDAVYTSQCAELSQAIGDELSAKARVLQLKTVVGSLKARIGLAQSILKSMPVV